ncbi:MAG: M48 family metallopeptidase [Roseovarius sp.]
MRSFSTLRPPLIALACALSLAGCVTTTQAPSQPRPAAQAAPKPAQLSSASVSQFKSVVARVEPVAERECKARTEGLNCDFKIVVDDRPNQPANAFQTLDRDGRPIIGFNVALIAEMQNRDEIAFVLGHEAAHHIRGHLARKQQSAAAGAILMGGLAAIAGGGQAAVDQAINMGASVGARTYSKDFELEADALGTVITRKAGYDPVRGVAYFDRAPDPGDRFLGTHPPNAQRIETVRRVNAGL